MSETTDMTLIRDNYRVDWCFLDEGWNGMYDENNPDDEPLLRFDCYTLVDGEWEMMDDASYCTAVPVGTSDVVLHAGLERIMDNIYGKDNVKKICEDLSWMSPDWFDENGNNQYSLSFPT